MKRKNIVELPECDKGPPRQLSPKGLDFNEIGKEEIDRAVVLLNNGLSDVVLWAGDSGRVAYPV